MTEQKDGGPAFPGNEKNSDGTQKAIAECAYGIADAMLAARAAPDQRNK